MYRLVAHPDFPPAAVQAVEAVWCPAGEEWPGEEDGNRLLKFVVTGAAGLVLPESRAPERANDLWKATCFELFFRFMPNGYYMEYNFSPSCEWAAYAFDGYRAGMRDLPFYEPAISGVMVGDTYEFRVNLDASVNPPATCAMSLAAVIEEQGGIKSYWALAHAPGKPDFHHDACFIA